MKNLKTITLNILSIVFLASMSSCEKEEVNPATNNTNNQNLGSDSVTSKTITYEATGGYSFTNSSSNDTKSYTHNFVKINYKDQSHLWANTQYTFLNFYNTNAQAAAEMITIVILGKEMPKSGTYKIGPWPIASDGISESSKLLSDEMAVMVVANGYVTKRNSAITIQVVNDNGKISIVGNNEFEVFDNITGILKGKCKNINLIRTTKKI